MKRRNFFAIIAAAFAAKTTHTAFGGVPFNRVLADNSLALLPKGTPPFSVGQELSWEYIFRNYGVLIKAIAGHNEIVEDPKGPCDGWKHWVIHRTFLKLTTTDGWIVWAESRAMPPAACWELISPRTIPATYVVTEVRRATPEGAR